MGFKNIKEIGDAEIGGAVRQFTFRKTPSQVSSGSVWFDLSMSPGNPVPNYYAAAPMISVNLKQSTDGGFFHGSSVAPATKYLKSASIMSSSTTGLPMPIMILDYLQYVPFVDEGTTDEQFVINNNPLPRYADGSNVKIMAVSVASRTGGQKLTVKYTNQDGISGRITTPVFLNSAPANGGIITSEANSFTSSMPFLPLQKGDTGVRSIESVTMLGADVGLFTLVLVKTIATLCLNEQTAPVEKDYLLDSGLNMPVITDDAYLNMICLPQGSLANVILIGDLKFIWK